MTLASLIYQLPEAYYKGYVDPSSGVGAGLSDLTNHPPHKAHILGYRTFTSAEARQVKVNLRACRLMRLIPRTQGLSNRRDGLCIHPGQKLQPLAPKAYNLQLDAKSPPNYNLTVRLTGQPLSSEQTAAILRSLSD